MTRSEGAPGSGGNGTWRALAAAGALAALALALSGCGEARPASAAAEHPPGAPGWDEPDDYAYTLALFDGPCGGDAGSGTWALTVADGVVTESRPLDEAARDGSWAEGAPTIGELHSHALGVREDGAYDTVDIAYAGDGRPTRVHYADEGDERDEAGYEGCELISDYRPAG